MFPTNLTDEDTRSICPIFFLINSCAFIVENEVNEIGKDTDRIISKPQKQILIKGKCIKRRGFM